MISIKYSEILFYLYFGLLLVAKGLGLYDGQVCFKFILVLAFLCLAAKVAIEKYNVLHLMLTIGIILVGVTTYILSGEKGLLLNFMMMVGMLHVDSKRVIRLAGYLWGATFGVRVIISLFDMQDTVYKVHDKLGLGYIFRWSLGYSHPNVLHVSYLLLAALIILILGNKCKLWHLGTLLLGNIVIFLYSVSYTGFIIVMALLLGRLFLMIHSNLLWIEKGLWALVVPACAGISIIGPLVLTDGYLHYKLNIITNTRLWLTQQFLNPEYIHLWGNRLSEITTNALTMDNAYVFAFIIYGIVPFCITIGITIYTVIQLLRQNRIIEVLVILVIGIGGITEPFLYNTSFKNISFIYMGEMLFCTENEKEKIGILAKYNKMISFSKTRILKGKEIIKDVTLLTWKKLIVAACAGTLALLASHGVMSYPDGYVVRRSDCEDRPKIFHYYDVEPGFENYKEMVEFEPGEKVEYFSGNIVKVEKVRNNVMIFLLVSTGSYLLCGAGENLRKAKRRA